MISIVITTHGEMLGMVAMIDCLQTQREYRVGEDSNTGKPVLWVAGKRFIYPMEIIISVDGPRSWGPPEAYSPKYKFITCPQEHGPAGHHTRHPGIKAATGEWITLTNSDNYFMSGWLFAIAQHFERRVGLIYWNCVNNLWKWGTQGGVSLKRGYVDLSCVCVRTEIAKEVGFPWRNYDGDYDYIAACMEAVRKRRLEIRELKETLCVHN